ncbi:siroheme decarboxylase subunit alpha [Desulfonatronovibrio hydrogenovorans]|uniref:siroheme decarboxylase subunit alpha n=1 Tax=Desulfonatronovibrio hydrogenovorans TaxID=53245 RepID=UPI00048ADDE3|nr:AsnC family transcriptional regulator [Desulfonatronovibrio hydrogenovorans]
MSTQPDLSREDRKILDIIQTDFPLESRPYAVIGAKIGLTEAETLSRVRRLKQKGVIRRIGANFQSKKLGWHSTLCAACVPQDKIEEFVAEVNSHPGVTHNYLRRHRQNIWFTYIGPSEEAVRNALQEITRKTGIEILNLPAKSMFKIKVDFPMEDRG